MWAGGGGKSPPVVPRTSAREGGEQSSVGLGLGARSERSDACGHRAPPLLRFSPPRGAFLTPLRGTDGTVWSSARERDARQPFHEPAREGEASDNSRVSPRWGGAFKGCFGGAFG